MDNNNNQNPTPPQTPTATPDPNATPAQPAAPEAPVAPAVDPNVAQAAPVAAAPAPGMPDPNAPAQTVPPTQDAANNPIPVQAEAPKKSNTKMFVIVALILLVLIGAVAAYMMLAGKSAPAPQEGAQQNTQNQNVASELEGELNQISIEPVEQDFADVDSELSQL